MSDKLLNLKRALFFNWDKVYKKHIDKPWSECEQHILNKLTTKAKAIIKAQYIDRVTPYKGEVTDKGLIVHGPWALRLMPLHWASYYIDKDTILRYYPGRKTERKRDYYCTYRLLDGRDLFLFKKGASTYCIHYAFKDKDKAPEGLYTLRKVLDSHYYKLELDKDGKPMFDEQGGPLRTLVRTYQYILIKTTLKEIKHLLTPTGLKSIKEYYEQQ